MPGMILQTEEDTLIRTIRAVADREYRRGVAQGLGVAEVAVNWLRMSKVKSGKPPYSYEELAAMIEERVKQEKDREGI